MCRQEVRHTCVQRLLDAAAARAEVCLSFIRWIFALKILYYNRSKQENYRVNPEFYVGKGGNLRRYSSDIEIDEFEVYDLDNKGEYFTSFYNSLAFVVMLLDKSELSIKKQTEIYEYFDYNWFFV